MSLEPLIAAYGAVGIIALTALIIWTAVWKAIALWKSARKSQIIWFIAFIVFNTAGILPIIYLLFFQKKMKKRRR
jgi:methionyl-tRNA synthetase